MKVVSNVWYMQLAHHTVKQEKRKQNGVLMKTKNRRSLTRQPFHAVFIFWRTTFLHIQSHKHEKKEKKQATFFFSLLPTTLPIQLNTLHKIIYSDCHLTPTCVQMQYHHFGSILTVVYSISSTLTRVQHRYSDLEPSLLKVIWESMLDLEQRRSLSDSSVYLLAQSCSPAFTVRGFRDSVSNFT